MDHPTLSVVIPIYDEHENLDALVARLVPVLEVVATGHFEVVFVDDGSRDGSGVLLDRLHERDARLKTIHLSRNFGHQAALQAGLDAASGDAIVSMDGDLQDPPEVIPELVAAWRAGHEVVYAIRRRRKEGVLKRASYALFYRTLRRVSDIDLPLDAGDFCLVDRRVAKALSALPERARFLRGLRSWVGFSQIGVEYERAARHAGSPKYTLRALVRLALSGYVGFSSTPLRLATWFGFATASLGFAFAFWAIATKLLDIASPRGWVSLVSVILCVGGAQLVVLGVIGEYLGRVYEEVRQRPLYLVRSTTGLDGPVQPPRSR
jgi:dolichol-phosphate mannosyltransferase